MENFDIKLNLLKLSNAGIMSIKGKAQTKVCLVVPIEDNHLYVSRSETGAAKAVYVDLSAYSIREPKYDQTHLVKQSLPKDVRTSMTEEELKAQPILGGMKPFGNNAASVDAPFVQAENDDDLPF